MKATSPSSECYFLAIKDVEKDGARVLRIRAGRYIDRFERRDGRWAIAERVLADDWSRVQNADGVLDGGGAYRYGQRGTNDLVYAIRRGRVARGPLPIWPRWPLGSCRSALREPSVRGTPVGGR